MPTKKKKSKARFNFLAGFFAGLKPIPLLKVSEWADLNRYLTTESAAEPGRWKTSRTPYLKDIMDCLSPNSPYIEVVFMKGVQIGGSESALNVMATFIDNAPCPIMYVMPTIDMARSFSTGRVDPMLENCPSLREKIRPAREKDSGNTQFVKRYYGGMVKFCGANSAASLRSVPVKILILDETDAYPLNVGEEGSPVSLAEKRTSTFGMKKKIFKLSTPTVEGISVIEREFLTTDQRYYFVPCPHCNEKQILKFDGLQWTPGKPETVKYACEHCGVLIEERYKTKMLAQGEWRATKIENISPIRCGFHLASFYSPVGWLRWEDIIFEFEKTINDVNLERTFVNTILAETYKTKGEVPSWQALFNRREVYQENFVNKKVCFITAGADVQKDRIEVQIIGWAKQKENFSISYHVINGDTTKDETWAQLETVLNFHWEREDGIVMPLMMMAIDANYNTNHVYNFCRKHETNRVIPVRGMDKQNVITVAPKPIDTTIAGKRIGFVKVWNVGVSIVKSELYGWLRLEMAENGTYPAGYCHFPQYPQEFFKGLTAEELQLSTDKKGFVKYEWVKKYQRNEPLDTFIYARAAANVIGMDRFSNEDFDAVEQSYIPKSKTENTTKKNNSSYWSRGKKMWD